MKLYSRDMIDSFENKKQKGKQIIKYSLFVIVPIFVLLLIFVKLRTKTLFVLLCTLDLSVFAVIFTYNMLENIVKSNDSIRHINNILNTNPTSFSGTITSISKEITLQRNVHIVEVEIKSNSIVKAYFNVDLFDMNFKIGDNINVKTSNNFISECEVVL